MCTGTKTRARRQTIVLAVTQMQDQEKTQKLQVQSEALYFLNTTQLDQCGNLQVFCQSVRNNKAQHFAHQHSNESVSSTDCACSICTSVMNFLVH